MNGADRISTKGTGLWWTHHFNPVDKIRVLQTYVYQKSVICGGGYGYPLKHLGAAPQEVWYTIYFDPEYVTMYVSANRYDDSEKSFANRYKHGITDITTDGGVHLKISSGTYRIDEISLLGGCKGGEDKAKGEEEKKFEPEKERLFMPDEI